jgi:RNA polymerase sigma-70 factor, ECF subfamily
MWRQEWYKASDSELIEACIKQVSMAQKQLFDRYAPYSLSIIQRYVLDYPQAEDVFLKGFEKVFNKLHFYNSSIGELKHWIRKIMVNEALNYVRDYNKFRFVDEFEHIDVAVENEFEYNLEIEALLNAIKDLKPPNNLIFNMVIDGYKYKEIAEVLNLNEATCRSCYLRSRIALMAIFKKNELISKT